MPIAYSWEFAALDVYPTYQTVTNAVHNMHWRLTADDGLGHQAQAYGTQPCGAIDVNDFTPYANLTLAEVQDWCEQSMGLSQVNEIKASLVWRINELLNPTTMTLDSPW